MDVRGIWEADEAGRSKLIFFRKLKGLSSKINVFLTVGALNFFSSFLAGKAKGEQNLHKREKNSLFCLVLS